VRRARVRPEDAALDRVSVALLFIVTTRSTSSEDVLDEFVDERMRQTMPEGDLSNLACRFLPRTPKLNAKIAVNLSKAVQSTTSRLLLRQKLFHGDKCPRRSSAPAFALGRPDRTSACPGQTRTGKSVMTNRTLD
jgi:hypothetical protein